LIRTKTWLEVLIARAKALPSGASTISPRFRLDGEIYGNGCDGSTANGVKTGKTFSRKYSSRLCFSYLVSELKDVSSSPADFN
jgi:hypothetical protein